MQAVSSWIMHRGRTGKGPAGVVLRPGGIARSRPDAPATVNDIAIAVSLLAVLAVIFLGGLLMLFSWVTAGLPPSLLTTCARAEDCATLGPAQSATLWGEDDSRAENATLITDPV